MKTFYQIIWRKNSCAPFHVLVDDDSLTLEQLSEKGKILKEMFPQYDVWLINESWKLINDFYEDN